MPLGSLALKTGRRLGPADLGVLAALGLAEVPVRRRLSIALLSTGDEVREPGQPLAAHQIYDANRFILAGMTSRSASSRAAIARAPTSPSWRCGRPPASSPG